MTSIRRRIFLLGMIMMMWAGNGYAAPLSDTATNLPDAPNAYTAEALAAPNAFITDSYLDAGFETHLPLIKIRFLPDDPGTAENDWYSGLEVTIYDGEAANALTDAPTAVIPVKGRMMDNQAPAYREKQDYYLRLLGADGLPTAHSLLGLDESSEYFLIGSLYDRSLLRNYLGYTLAGQMMENVPGVRFCEVVMDQGDQGTLYQGVYLLIEVKRSPDTYVFKRTTHEEGMFLETYGSNNYPEDGRIEVPFTEAVATDESLWEALWEVGGQISHIEEVIYSDDLDTFSRFDGLIDVDSFVDFFILNEVMGNYAAKEDAYYRYSTAQGRLFMGPVWNFERALDNEIDEVMDPDAIRFDEGGYFERLIKSRAFLSRIKERYLALSVSILNGDNYNRLIDDAVRYLGPAIERDWVRWTYYFQQHKDLALAPVQPAPAGEPAVPFERNPQSARWELTRIRYLLREHDLFTAQRLAFLDASIGTEMRGREASYVQNTIYFVAFLVALALVIHFARRYAD